MVREAAKQVDIRLNAYREHYQNVTPEKIIAMVAYQFALENLKMKNRNDTRPYADKIEELTEVLETYFNYVRSGSRRFVHPVILSGCDLRLHAG